MIFFLINNPNPPICKKFGHFIILASEKRKSTTKDYRLVIFYMSEFIPQFSYLLILFYFIVVIVIDNTIYSFGNANKLINWLIDIFIPTDKLIHWKNLTKFLFYSLRNFEKVAWGRAILWLENRLNPLFFCAETKMKAPKDFSTLPYFNCVHVWVIFLLAPEYEVKSKMAD